MASLNYNSMLFYVLKGNIDFDTDTFKAMLVTSAYTPDQDNHDFRNDVVANEVVGAGYAAGGAVVTATVTQDNANNRVEVAFSDPSWASATITARGAVIYKSRGGAASADELVAYVDFGADIVSTGGTFLADFTTPLRFTNV